MVQSCSQYDYPADDPPPPSTIYSINFFNPPSVYRVNEDKLFTINIEPLLNGETGKFKMYFEIEHSGIVLGRSNFVFFDENTPGIKTFEWGGGAGIDFGPTFDYGDCDIVAYLEKYDLFPNQHHSRQSWTRQAGSNQIRIYHFDDNDIPAANNFEVEVDYQENANIRPFLSTTDLKGAFDPCLLRFELLGENEYGNGENLQAMSILNDNDVIKDFIIDNKDALNRFYFCSISVFVDENNNELNLTGKSIRKGASNTDFGSLISYEEISGGTPPSSEEATNYVKWFFNKVVIHEFGHQITLGSEAHTDHNGNEFCVMHQGSYVSFNPQSPNLFGRSFYVNPHFCTKHINEITNSL